MESVSSDDQLNSWKTKFFTFCDETNTSTLQSGPSWKEVDWDEYRAQVARELATGDCTVSTAEKAIYEAEADAFWDKFYDCYNDKFFKDRHYLIKEFPELHEHGSKGGVQLRLRSPTLAPSIESAAPATLSQGPAGTKIVLEVGCGAGNTIIPLLATMKQSIFFGCDFSKSALNVFKNRFEYDSYRCHLFHWDITERTPTSMLSLKSSCDVVLMIFVLSAIAPAKMSLAVKNVAQMLKPGGVVLFRDYGLYDMTQMRFVAKGNRKLEEKFYVRADGTTAYFFELDTLEHLFKSEGLIPLELRYDTRELQNRKRRLMMHRVWVQARFQRPMHS